MGVGAGLGCLAMVLAFVIMLFLGTMGYLFGMPRTLMPFIVVTIGGIVLMLPRKTRRIGLGFTIVTAASWLVLIGPCAGILAGLNGGFS